MPNSSDDAVIEHPEFNTPPAVAEELALRLKINLYNGMETRAVAAAAARMGSRAPIIDCLMVGDSYLTTHLRRETTKIETVEEQRRILSVMAGLIAEVDRERSAFTTPLLPWLLADFPDGAAIDVSTALTSADVMLKAGADAVKLEIADAGSFRIVEALVSAGLRVVAHIGYRPQHVANRKFGDNLDEALSLIGEARNARNAGAFALVIERVAEPVAERLARPDPRALPIYAIFSGRAPHCGQSLNIFDATVRPSFPARAFPPTAILDPHEYPDRYTEAVVSERIEALMAMALLGEYPKRAPSKLDPDAIAKLDSADPWGTE